MKAKSGQLAQLRFNCDSEIFKRLSPNHRDGVDQEAGRTLHPDLATKITLGLHQLLVLVAGQAFGELVGIQVDLVGKLNQFLVCESALVLSTLAFKKHIVIFPEPILIGGAFTGFRSPVRFVA